MDDIINSRGWLYVGKNNYENFKSFKNETVIDFTRINYKFLENNVSNNGVLKGVAFYGANASGNQMFYGQFAFIGWAFWEEKNPVTFMKCLFSDEPEFSLQYFFVIESREIHYLIDFHTEKGIINENYILIESYCFREWVRLQSQVLQKRKFIRI